MTDADFIRLVDFIKTHYGINLEKKRILIEGRLSNMLIDGGYTDYKAYLDKVLSGNNSNEMTVLINKLTTNHTFFLREPEHFEFLKSTVLPYIEETVTEHDARIWCAASSTGQEPYTLAMTIDEYFGARKKFWKSKILATDIATDVLTTAQKGIYSPDLLKDVPEEWMKKYFIPLKNGDYQVSDDIRKEVVYRQFNLMNKIVINKPFDLISCRNVMIYFEMQTKMDLIERLYDVLKPGGYLFIGHAENIPKNTRFDFVKPAVYRKPM